MADLTVLLLALIGSAGMAVAGALAGARLRRWPLAASAAVVPVVAVASALAGLAVAALLMFGSPRDLRILLLVLLPAGLVAGGVAAMLSRRLSRDVASVADLAVRPEASTDHLPAELVELVGELRRARAELEEGHGRERRLEASRRDLVAWVSHDLRTPLAGLRAMTEALEDGVVEDAPTVARYHRRMRQEVARLTAMVDDLLELALLQADARRLSLSRVALSDLVADALASVEPLAAAAGVLIRPRVVDGDTPVVADAAGIGRVLANLLVNAVQHTPAGGTVEVVTGDGDPEAWVEVADACGGIPTEDLPRLFEVAFRGQAARTPAPDGPAPAGAGLGLAIAAGIVAAHGGEVTVTNDGPGCRFRVRLPLALGSHQGPAARGGAGAVGGPEATSAAPQGPAAPEPVPTT